METSYLVQILKTSIKTFEWAFDGYCDTPALGLIGLIEYSNQQIATFFRKSISKKLRG